MSTKQTEPQPVIAVTGADGACYAVPFASLEQYRVPAEQQAAFAQSIVQATGVDNADGEVSGYLWEQVQTGVSGWGFTPVFSTMWVPNPIPTAPAATASSPAYANPLGGTRGHGYFGNGATG